MLIETLFENILKYHYNILKRRMSFYPNVFLSFNGNIVNKNIVCDVGLTKNQDTSFYLVSVVAVE